MITFAPPPLTSTESKNQPQAQAVREANRTVDGGKKSENDVHLLLFGEQSRSVKKPIKIVSTSSKSSSTGSDSVAKPMKEEEKEDSTNSNTNPILNSEKNDKSKKIISNPLPAALKKRVSQTKNNLQMVHSILWPPLLNDSEIAERLRQEEDGREVQAVQQVNTINILTAQQQNTELQQQQQVGNEQHKEKQRSIGKGHNSK